MERLWAQLKALFRNARYMTLAHHYDALNLGFELMVFAKQNKIVDYLVNRWGHLKKKLGASMFLKELRVTHIGLNNSKYLIFFILLRQLLFPVWQTLCTVSAIITPYYVIP